MVTEYVPESEVIDDNVVEGMTIDKNFINTTRFARQKEAFSHLLNVIPAPTVDS